MLATATPYDSVVLILRYSAKLFFGKEYRYLARRGALICSEMGLAIFMAEQDWLSRSTMLVD